MKLVRTDLLLCDRWQTSAQVCTCCYKSDINGGKICRVELCTELFYAIILTFSPAFCLPAIPTSCYILNVFLVLYIGEIVKTPEKQLKFKSTGLISDENEDQLNLVCLITTR